MPALWREGNFFELEKCFGLPLLGPMLTVVTAVVSAGVTTNSKLATLDESWSAEKTDSLGVHSVQFEVLSRVFFFSPSGQHRVFTYTKPKLWHIESRIPRPNSPHLLSNNFRSFKTVQTDYSVFSRCFSITRSQEQAVHQFIHIVCSKGITCLDWVSLSLGIYLSGQRYRQPLASSTHCDSGTSKLLLIRSAGHTCAKIPLPLPLSKYQRNKYFVIVKLFIWTTLLKLPHYPSPSPLLLSLLILG